MPALYVTRTTGSGTQSFSSGTWTKVQYTTKVFDTASCYDATTNYRFTPTVAGYYQITGSVSFATVTGTGGIAAIRKNGNEFMVGIITNGVSGTGFFTEVNGLVYCNGSTDYIEIYAYYASGATGVAASDTQTYFTAVMVRSA
jgi:hypothetical protein